MQFSLMFFSSTDQGTAGGRYDLLLDAARFADERGFAAVWTPERHFHAFGGLFPNPAVTSAALATATRRIGVRAGSLVSPLHDAIRIAEDWAVVDNLSGGRVAVSFGSGWNVDDFVLAPQVYARRQAHMYEQIEIVRRLWRGEAVTRENGAGRTVDVRLHPTPVQTELPIWITSSGHPDTFVSAGRSGANVLTHLLGQDLPVLAERIAAYRRARTEAGLAAGAGIVTLMLHTFVGPDLDEVRALVRRPFRDYLKSAVSLETKSASGGGAISGGHTIEPHAVESRDLEALADVAFERYFREGALMGTLSTARQMVERVRAIGVDEIAALVDFGLSASDVRRGLDSLDVLRASAQPARRAGEAGVLASAFSEVLE